MLTDGDKGIQAVGPKSSRVTNTALAIGRYGSLFISALSGGSGYAAGGDVEVLVNRALDYFDYPPVPTNSITYSLGGVACVAFSAFNMSSYQKFWDDLSDLINDHLRKNGCTRKTTLNIVAFIGFLIFGMYSAYNSASFTYNSISDVGVALAVAGTNWFGTGMANREGVTWAGNEILDFISGCCRKDTTIAKGPRTCGNTAGKALLLPFSVVGAVSGLAGLTGNPMIETTNLGNKITLLVSGAGPTSVFAGSSFKGLSDLLLKSSGPEASEATVLLNDTRQLVIEHSRGRKIVVAGAVFIPSVIAAVCLASATSVLIKSLFGDGPWQTILTVVALLLGTLILFAAFEQKAYNLTNQLLDRGYELLAKCIGRQKTGEGAPLLANAGGRVEEV